MNSDTKRRIDNARDVLVGKVPDPKSQIEQITLALMYRFMDYMDRQSEEMGGKPQFFAGKYSKFRWANLTDPRLGGLERRELYVDTIEGMSKNPHIPQLFRDIFKDAFLPYRDYETLRLFLKEIDGFPLDHTEDLGDAYEDLLSIMSSQGDAGQFRTPRHIIDFIVKVVDPKKDDTILDPACGTAGFLIFAYQHILEKNKKKMPGDKLTPDEKGRLVENFVGYDISPDMVRMSLVNMYLHGFKSPKIHEYDTLTSEDRWNEHFDVIMANPPFMTPKGGIRPHNRFAVKAKRSEVLFVDYIAEHLNLNGRAGVIVPEGIIFQSTTAYKALRKMLVDELYLYAVVSLPQGVFQPYSGVKTSILLMDREVAKRTDNILFVKIENDGFDLGAQRKPIDKTDIPAAIGAISAYKKHLVDSSAPFDIEDSILAHIVPKSKISGSGDYNLAGDRHKEVIVNVNQKWSMVELGDVCELKGGGTPSRAVESYWHNGNIKWISAKHINGNKITSWETITEVAVKESATNLIAAGSVILVSRVSVGKVAIADSDYAINQDLTGLFIKPPERINLKYLYWLLVGMNDKLMADAQGLGVKGITHSYLKSLKIPLPPLEIQEQIVAEIEEERRLIEANKKLIELMEQKIKKKIAEVWGE